MVCEVLHSIRVDFLHHLMQCNFIPLVENKLFQSHAFTLSCSLVQVLLYFHLFLAYCSYSIQIEPIVHVIALKRGYVLDVRDLAIFQEIGDIDPERIVDGFFLF